MKKKIKIIILAVMLIFLSTVLIVGFNNSLQIDKYSYVNNKIPDGFDGYRIVQLSDLHDASFGENNSDLISKVKDLAPDIIVLTGDMIDKDSDYLMPQTEALMVGIADIAPVYAVTGNHEPKSLANDALTELYKQVGINEITLKQVKLEKDGDEILLTGLGSYYKSYQKIDKSDSNYNSMFNILLYHWSNRFEDLADLGFDLILSGHAHGGIVRLPFVGGLKSNNGEWFPKYDSGFYTIGNTTMLVNRGLGGADFPRFNNRSQIILLTLEKNKK